MKKRMTNMEYKIVVNSKKLILEPKDLDKISEAWGLGDYRIWFEMDDSWGNPHIVIEASREVDHAGVNITRHWRDIRKAIEQGEIPDWLVEEALK